MNLGLLSFIYGIVLSVLQYIRFYTLSTCFSSYMDPDVGVQCKYGRDFDCSMNDPPHPSSSCSEISSTNYDETLHGKKHSKHLPTTKSCNKSKISPIQIGTGNSSGFQSGSSLRSSINSTISSSSASGHIQRTLSTDTVGGPDNFTDDDSSSTTNRSPALSSIAERHFGNAF